MIYLSSMRKHLLHYKVIWDYPAKVGDLWERREKTFYIFGVNPYDVINTLVTKMDKSMENGFIKSMENMEDPPLFYYNNHE